jgi:restriction system protein
MAHRRDKHLLHELAALPWWVGLLVAVVVYVAIRWLLPAVGSSNAFLRSLGEALPDKAWWFAVPFVVVAGIAAFNASHRRRLLDDQTGIDSLRALSWQGFERLVGEAYRRRGYVVEEIGGSAPDGGVDLVLHRQGSKVVVQCKRWRYAQVGVGRIREFYGVTVAEKAERGIVVTTGTFTPDAVEFARGKPLELVDGGRLAELVARVQPDKPVVTVPTCPKCGSEMVQRVARRGVNAGKAF